jgi:hypothetical protein
VWRSREREARRDRDPGTLVSVDAADDERLARAVEVAQLDHREGTAGDGAAEHGGAPSDRVGAGTSRARGVDGDCRGGGKQRRGSEARLHPTSLVRAA